jgi:serine/threonine protein kinase
MSAPEVTGVGIDLCRALSALHGSGLLHRDIKAHNAMRAATLGCRESRIEAGSMVARAQAAVLVVVSDPASSAAGRCQTVADRLLLTIRCGAVYHARGSKPHNSTPLTGIRPRARS